MPITRRPMGNAQARQTALGRSPAYGNTTNPNGAQTASAYDPLRQPPAGISPQNPAWMASRQEAARMNQSSQPMMAEASGQQEDPAVDPMQSQTLGMRKPDPRLETSSYPGGDVAGQAQYYRNTALQGYRPPGSSGQQARLAQSLQPGTDINDPRLSGLNSYDTFSAQMDDPNRLTPDWKFNIARRNAAGAMDYDPTNQGGSRFARGAERIQQAEAYDQAAIAAGTQAEQQRMQGIASNSQDRAMDPNSQGRQFAYQNAQGGMVATNRLGQLQEMAQQNPNDPDIQVAIAEEKIRTSGLRAKQEDFQREYAAAHGGMSDRSHRIARTKALTANRAAKEGIITSKGAASRAEAAYERARDNTSFNQKMTSRRRSALNAENSAALNKAAGESSRILPSGQFSDAARTAAKSQINSLMNAQAAGNSRDRFHGEVVRDAGLTGDPKTDTPMAAAEKIFANDISTPEQAIAFQKYWRAMSRSDAKWLKIPPSSKPSADKISILNEMAQVPPDQMQNWFDQNRDRLMAMRQSAFESGAAAGRFGSTPALPFTGH